MQRRKFLTVVTLGAIGAMPLLFLQFSLKDILRSALYFLKLTFKLPKEGKDISIETALNSRCTSDYDGNPEKFHWGMFDRTRKLSDEQVKKIVKLAKIPRFTDQKVKIRSERKILTFIVENQASGIIREWIMVESGMQQQTVGLVCAALGVGILFRNLGKDGTSISDTDYGTIRIRLDPMKPTYNGSFWSNLAPSGSNPWLKGNLPNPVRNGDKALISNLGSLKMKNNGSKKSTEQSISQLLWAARGRTPHFYKSRPWGMTIPTWAGEQNISSVYLVSNNRLLKYTNWDNNRPTHALSELNTIDKQLFHKLIKSFSANNGFIILGKNEDFARALWEVGYQFLNLLLQASVLNIDYRAFLLDIDQKVIFEDIGIKAPVAILAF